MGLCSHGHDDDQAASIVNELNRVWRMGYRAAKRDRGKKGAK